jgi:ABC-type oligopeptide transport system ATPase subunit
VIEREERQYLTAVADVSLEIEKGQTFALVGESGSGKSTIAKMVVGLLAASSGASSSAAAISRHCRPPNSGPSAAASR